MSTYILNKLDIKTFQSGPPPASGTRKHDYMHENRMLITLHLLRSIYCLSGSVRRLFGDFVPPSVLKVDADDACGMRDQAVMREDYNL